LSHGVARLEEDMVFALVRMYVPLVVRDQKSGASRQIMDEAWDYIVKDHAKWRSRHVKPLLLTHRDMQEDTSLIVKADDPDSLADFIATHISSIPNLRGIWVLNMANIRVFRLPKDRPRDLRRFTVTIDALPKHVRNVYERVSSLKPSDEIIITYIAQTHHSFNAAILVSVLARSRNHMEAFVREYIRPIHGVEDTEITYISKTQRLVSPEQWLKEVGPYLVSPGRSPVKRLDVDDDSLFAAC
jgi:DNA-binding Lrp family transcriptional regulator